MGVRPYKSFTFDGESSLNYGVYLTGEGVFNAPERAVEMIEIPGRNGHFALDKGNFNNISVTYRAGLVDYSESTFATKMSAVRNWLCSKVGYKRLEDDYNANEYRMALYMSGVEVDHEDLQTGQFEITFECKPQRWLTSGETAISVANGGTVTNPTLFDSRPLCELSGYGNLNIGSDTIEIHNEPIGNVIVYNGKTWNSSTTRTITIDTQYANNGDTIRVKTGGTWSAQYSEVWELKAGTITSSSSTITGNGTGGDGAYIGHGEMYPYAVLWDNTFTYGTSATKTVTVSFSVVTSNYGTLTGSIGVSIAYNGSNTFTLSRTVSKPSQFTSSSPELQIANITLSSTQTLLNASLIYIDLDIGEAYAYKNGEYVSVNNGVVIPAELTVLSPGNTTITYDNTLSGVKITPRWWKV